MNIRSCTAHEKDQGARLDVFLAGCFSEWTRSRIQGIIRDEKVLIQGKTVRSNHRMMPGEEVLVQVEEPKAVDVLAQDIPLNIIYEDDDMLVINKARGMVVHPAAGNQDGTLVNALLHHCHDLSGIGGEIRPGIVHRIDKDTTGLLVVAKNDRAHVNLAEQVKQKTAHRIYFALVEGSIAEDGQIDAPIGRHKTDRKRMAVVPDGRSAVTMYRVIRQYQHETLLEVALMTGRTHQIRVHMAHLGHPVVGDPVYGFKKQRYHLDGQMLHAARLELCHPRTGLPMVFHAPLPDDFESLIKKLNNREE